MERAWHCRSVEMLPFSALWTGSPLLQLTEQRVEVVGRQVTEEVLHSRRFPRPHLTTVLHALETYLRVLKRVGSRGASEVCHTNGAPGLPVQLPDLLLQNRLEDVYGLRLHARVPGVAELSRTPAMALPAFMVSMPPCLATESAPSSEEWLETVLTRCEQQQKSGIYIGIVEAKQSELMIQLTEEQ
jgi:hypothetical protein